MLKTRFAQVGLIHWLLLVLVGVGCGVDSLSDEALSPFSKTSRFEEIEKGRINISLDCPTGKVYPMDKPQTIHLAYTRNIEKANKVWISIEKRGADLNPAKTVKEIKKRKFDYEMDVSNFEIGKITQIPFELTLFKGVAASFKVYANDNLGNQQTIEVMFSNETKMDTRELKYNSSMRVVPPSFDPFNAQLEAFQKKRVWAKKLVTSALRAKSEILKFIKPTVEYNRLGKLMFWKDVVLQKKSILLHHQWSLMAQSPPNAGIVWAQGKMVFRDTPSCSGPSFGHDTSNAECETFKGVSYVQDFHAHVRPLPASILVKYSKLTDPETNDWELCDQISVKLNNDGSFRVPLLQCDNPGSTKYKISITAFLEYQIVGSPGAVDDDAGYVRAWWPIEDVEDLFDSAPEEHGVTFLEQLVHERDGVENSVPALGFEQQFDGPEESKSYDLGLRMVAQSEGNAFDYLRAVLSGFANLVELHERLKKSLQGTTFDYLEMFSSANAGNFPRSFSLYLNSDWASSGGDELFFLSPSDPNRGSFVSSLGTMAHEFGHSIHRAFAKQSLAYDYGFANKMQRSDGTVYDWGHGRGQYQEMGVAFVEGMATALGQFLINECRDAVPSRRIYGGVSDFATNMWSGIGDDIGDGEPLHHARYHLREVRNLPENSPAFLSRLNDLKRLTDEGVRFGHKIMTSNNEYRWAQLGCDLLDTEDDTSYLQDYSDLGFHYMADFTHEVWKVLQGESDGRSFELALYQPPVGVEATTISFDQTLQTMSNFCPDCPGFLILASIFDIYGPARLSAFTAKQSPVAFRDQLVQQGLVTEQEFDILLGANFMESPNTPRTHFTSVLP